MPTGRPGSCAACDHPERDALDLALMSGAPYRDLKTRYGVSLRALSQHKGSGHHIDPRATDKDTSSVANAPDANGPWVHVETLNRLAEAVMASIPHHTRMAVADRMRVCDDASYIAEHLEGSLDAETAETQRRRNRGEVDVLARTGPNREWRLTWFANISDMQHDIQQTHEIEAIGGNR